MNVFVSLCLIGCVGLGSFCYAQQMDNEDKKKVIKDLDNLLSLNRSEETKVINTAISKLSSAGRDPNAAYDLLIQSKKFLMEVEKEKDKSRGKSTKNASNSLKDWMDREAKKYQDKNARKGLMLQYQWGVLVLKARLKENLMNATSHSTGGTEEEILDVTEFQKPAMDLLNAYLAACADPDFIDPSSKNGWGGKSGARIAEQSVLSTEVGEALGISNMTSKAFPDSLKNRDEIFDKLFFAGYRKTRNLPALRQAWNRRIAIEVALSKVNYVISSGKKSGMQGRVTNASENEFDEQGAAVLDQLRWKCELDCFELGDQANATQNMMGLIRATVDPVRREQGIRVLRDKLIQSMGGGRTPSGEKKRGTATASASAPSPAPRPVERPKKSSSPASIMTTAATTTPSTTATTTHPAHPTASSSSETNHSVADTPARELPQPHPAPSNDDFFEDS